MIHKEWLELLKVEYGCNYDIDKLLVARIKGKLHMIQKGNFSDHIESPFLSLLTAPIIHSLFTVNSRELVKIYWDPTICRCNFVVLMWIILGSKDYTFVMGKPKPSTFMDFQDQVSEINFLYFREFERLKNLIVNNAIETFKIVSLSDVEKNLIREIDRSMSNSRKRLEFLLRLFDDDLYREDKGSKS